VTFGDAATDTVTFTADVASNIIPSADNTYDLGASGSEWRNLFIDGTANIDSLVANTADINGGTIDGTVIGGSTPAAISGTTGTFSGNLTVDTNTLFVNASNNRVGVGTSSPSALLEVDGGATNYSPSATGTGLFHVTGAETSQYTFYVGVADAGVHIGHKGGSPRYLAFDVDETERMRITSSGKVGVGTTSPDGTLDVNGSIYASTIFRSTGGGSASIPSIQPGADNDTGMFWAASNTIGFSTAGNERARIDSSGRLMVGATSSNHRLRVSDETDRTQTDAQFNIEGSGYSAFLFLNGTAAHLGQNSNSRALRMYSGSNPAVGVNLAAGGNSWGTYSDERVKDIIEPIEGGIEKLSQLRTVIGRYKFDDADKRRVFLIAQDVQKVLPEAVTQDDSGDLSLQYQDLIPVLVKAVQEQQAIIEALEARVAALEA
jgi:hypothetical protein